MMRSHSAALLVALIFCCWPMSPSYGGSVASFDDIEFWVGQGSNRSALVIDWIDDSTTDPALVWGYRWDGAATGSDLVEAVLAADSRFWAKLDAPIGSSTIVFGLGYDASGDGNFALDDGTVFDEDGIALSGPTDVAQSVDPTDYYAEGWVTGFWHYGISNGNPFDAGIWSSSTAGMAQRALSDGSWDSWAFARPISLTVFAANPQAAEPPLWGDFDSDADVDGRDFLAWQRGFGIDAGATRAQGDANGDGAVNGADLQYWSGDYGSGFSSSGPIAAAVAVPEPAGHSIALSVVVFVAVVHRCYTPRRRFS